MADEVLMEDARLISSRVNLDGLRNATILVTGASGLIGTYFLSCLGCLREQGMPFDVHAQVFSADLPPHVRDLIRRGGFHLLRVDLTDSNSYAHIPEADIIVHAAGYSQPSVFMANPTATIQVNTTATAALLRRLRPGGRFLYVSSSEVYSGLAKPLATESDIGATNPLHPRACYIEGKRCGEALCNAFRIQGANVKTARLALAYGPGTRKHDKRVINSFIEKAICLGRIQLLDAGTVSRTYCYAADAAELLWRILLHGKHPLYNVGGHSTVTIAELAGLIAKMTDVEVVFPPRSAAIAGAPDQVQLDLTRVQTEFHKTDFLGLEQGLRRTIDWQRHLYL